MVSNLKNYLKNNDYFMKGYIRLNGLFYNLLTIISPYLNTKFRYKQVFKKTIDLKNPKTFNEKLLWLKLNNYNKNPLVIQCADKYAVRSYVEKCGQSHILNELYGAYDSVNDIDWSKLPNQFAMKWNFGSGFNIICDDKYNININECESKLNKWRKSKCWLPYSEMQYKYTKKKIICEKYLDSNQGFLPYDYKIYCFNGVPKAILLVMDRDGDAKRVFMSLDWELINTIDKYKVPDVLPDRPESLDIMIEASTALSKPFPFVRIDFYQHNGNAVFGEMTFTPSGGLYTPQTPIDGITMGEMLNIS